MSTSRHATCACIVAAAGRGSAAAAHQSLPSTLSGSSMPPLQCLDSSAVTYLHADMGTHCCDSAVGYRQPAQKTHAVPRAVQHPHPHLHTLIGQGEGLIQGSGVPGDMGPRQVATVWL